VRGAQGARDVLSTYQHRILLGTAMAMGVPLAFFLILQPDATAKIKRYGWLAVCVMSAGCFYSGSRGPWLGLGIVFVLLLVLGSRSLRRAMFFVGLLIAATLIAQPGVRGTLLGAYRVTVDNDSHKGGTFRYRFELWKVAYTKICESPWRFMFGYGPSAGKEIEIDWQLSYRDTRFVDRKIESWDNHFAYALFQTGMVGFIATFLLFFRVIYWLFRAWRASPPDRKDGVLCLMASALVLFYMMTNVLIFAKQLDYLFWSIAAAGPILAGAYLRSDESEPAEDQLSLPEPDLRLSDV
jgi:O-antigen ligase